MKLRGLPAEMKLGCLDVRPKTRTVLPFLACGFCKLFHIEYFMCELGHVTCRDCGTDELNKVCVDKVESPCFGCGTRMAMRRVHITNVQLQSEKWRCPCGYSATIREIHNHSRDAKYTQGCVLMEKKAEELELNHFKRTFYFVEDFRNMVEYAEDKMAYFFTYQLAKPRGPDLTDPDDMKRVERYISTLTDKLDEVRSAIRDVNDMNHEMLETLEAIFREDSWAIVNLDEVLSSPQNTYRAVISGIPVGLLVKHETLDTEDWVGIYMRGRKFETNNQTQREHCYPLKIKVQVRLHDAQGYTVARGGFVTYENGKYSSPSFEDPTLENVDYVGVSKFIRRSELNNTYHAIDGKLCLSFRFDPLYEVD